ncbi:MAG: cytochrome oxidase putative small subunit CydP, partial [Parazoarcus communis]
MSLPPPRLTDRRLVRDLVWVVILKLIVITALWWGFVREFRVPVDHDAMAVQLA